MYIDRQALWSEVIPNPGFSAHELCDIGQGTYPF